MVFEFLDVISPIYRSSVLFLTGVFLGVVANWIADHWGLRRRYRSPWSGFPPALAEVLSRRPWDYVPILGWISISRFGRILFTATNREGRLRDIPPEHALSRLSFLQKESISHELGMDTPTFWIRPLLVELGMGVFLAWFYSWMVVDNEIFLESIRVKFHEITLQIPQLDFSQLVVSYFLMVGFFFIMLCASLTDMDDYIIPDQINMPGTILGILTKTFFPFFVFAPLFWYIPQGPHDSFATTDLSTFFESYFGTMGTWRYAPLYIMVGCWAFWCFALLDRCWRIKFGFRKGFYLFLRRLVRSSMTWWSIVLFLLGSGAIIWLYVTNPNPDTTVCSISPDYDYYLDKPVAVGFLSPRNALFNALAGMAFGMLLIWSVRVIGYVTIRRESMGFGDVMLLGMIGSWIGWHGALVTFFLAPFLGLFFTLFRGIFGLYREIPYGPFLCLAAVIYTVFRCRFWDMFAPVFLDPVLIGGLFLFCMAMLAILLGLIEFLKKVLSREA